MLPRLGWPGGLKNSLPNLHQLEGKFENISRALAARQADAEVFDMAGFEAEYEELLEGLTRA